MTIETKPIPPLIKINELPPSEPSKPKTEKKQNTGVRVQALTLISIASFKALPRTEPYTLPATITLEQAKAMEKAGVLRII